jgi:hypothetical protein
MDSDPPPESPSSSRDSADDLRQQAAACRRLARQARTRTGATSLDALGEHFDTMARKLDPTSHRI